jgi:hypothetical protein
MHLPKNRSDDEQIFLDHFPRPQQKPDLSGIKLQATGSDNAEKRGV